MGPDSHGGNMDVDTVPPEAPAPAVDVGNTIPTRVFSTEAVLVQDLPLDEFNQRVDPGVLPCTGGPAAVPARERDDGGNDASHTEHEKCSISWGTCGLCMDVMHCDAPAAGSCYHCNRKVCGAHCSPVMNSYGLRSFICTTCPLAASTGARPRWLNPQVPTPLYLDETTRSKMKARENTLKLLSDICQGATGLCEPSASEAHRRAVDKAHSEITRAVMQEAMQMEGMGYRPPENLAVLVELRDRLQEIMVIHTAADIASNAAPGSPPYARISLRPIGIATRTLALLKGLLSYRYGHDSMSVADLATSLGASSPTTDASWGGGADGPRDVRRCCQLRSMPTPP